MRNARKGCYIAKMEVFCCEVEKIVFFELWSKSFRMDFFQFLRYTGRHSSCFGKGSKVRIVYLNRACEAVLQDCLAVCSSVSDLDSGAVFLLCSRAVLILEQSKKCWDISI